MTDQSRHPEDLAIMARRGTASEVELRRLSMQLRASETEEFLFRAGQSFDREEFDTSAEQAQVSRAVAAVLQRRSGKGRRPLAVHLWLGFVTLASAAAAATLVISPTPPQPAPPSAAARAPDAVSTPARKANANTPPSTELDAPNLVHELAPTPSANTPPKLETSTAAELFAAGNALRRRGQLEAAIASYQTLQRTFPRSREASLSLALLGRLFLGQHRNQEALTAYGRYLAALPGGELAEEAWYGQATALRRQGRAREERQIWESLLARHPATIYATLARERLAELD